MQHFFLLEIKKPTREYVGWETNLTHLNLMIRDGGLKMGLGALEGNCTVVYFPLFRLRMNELIQTVLTSNPLLWFF